MGNKRSAAGVYDDSASLLTGTIEDAPVGISPESATVNRAGRNQPIVFTGTQLPRIAEDGWLFGFDDRRLTRIFPTGREERHTSIIGVPNGIWILRRKWRP